MGKHINQAYLTRQFAFVTVGLFLSLLLTGYIGWQAVSQLFAKSQYDLAFARLVAASEKLQTELTLTLFGLDPRGDEGADRLREAYADLAFIYFELARADAAGPHGAKQEAFLADLETVLGAETFMAHRSQELLPSTQLIDAEMPHSHMAVWKQTENSISLEQLISRILQKSKRVVVAKGNYNSTDLGAIMQLIGNEFILVQRYVDMVSTQLAKEQIRETIFVLTLLVAMCSIGAIFGMATWLFAFRPMTRAIMRAQSDLETERDRALQAEQAKASFLAVMSHELRTPLNGVIGFATLLSKTALQRDQRDYVDTILTSSDTLLTVINDVLDFSKIEAGRLEIEKSEFELEGLVSNLLEVMGPSAWAKRIELVSYLAPSLPVSIVGDSARLRQVLFNLVGNAIKFTPQGSVSVEVRPCQTNENECEKFEISVVDTGIGIEPQALNSIFDRFTQADASTTRKYGGTGLGLAISRSLIEIMGGTLTADSGPGRGSTFKATLPLVKTEPPSQTIIEREAADIGARRILFVDDNATNCRLIALMLEGYGAKVTTVHGAGEAVSALLRAHASGEKFDVTLIGHHLSQADGFECLRMVRGLPAIADQIAVLCATSEEIHDENWTQKGFNAAIAKPVRQSRLIRLIADLLGGPAGGHEERQGDRKANADSEQADHPVRESSELRSNGNSRRILLVDDNVANQKLIMAFLGQDPVSIDVACDGREAVELSRTLPYDLILMDICLPGMGGVEATRHIRAPGACNEKTPVIAVTANVLKGDREAYLAAGMNDYITKPIRQDDLRAIVAKWWNRKEFVSASEARAS